MKSKLIRDNMNKYYIVAILFAVFLQLLSFAVEAFPESYYAEKFCRELGGVEELVLEDRTRVDCVVDNYVIEVDFAKKWYEGVGQSLHYATVTGKNPAVALIIGTNEERFYERAMRLKVCPQIKFFRIDKE